MAENNDDNDPFEEDIIFDQTDLLRGDRAYHHLNISQRANIMPRFFLFIRTISLCVAFVGLGICAALSQGPIIQIEVLSGMPTSQALHIFTAYCVGMLIGGILGSWLFEKYNRQFLIFMCLLAIGIFISILPFAVMSSFIWTLISLVAIGSGLSFMFTGGNVLCLDMWGRKGSGYLVSVHFCFALGAFLVPIVIHPFIMTANFSTLTNSSDLLERNPRSVALPDHLNVSVASNLPQLGDRLDYPSYGRCEMLNFPMGLLPFEGRPRPNSHSVFAAPTDTAAPRISDLRDVSSASSDANDVSSKVDRLPSIQQSPAAQYDLPLNVVDRDTAPNDHIHDEIATSVTHKLSKPVTTSNDSSTEEHLFGLFHSYEYYGITGMHVAYLLIGVFMLLNAIISLIFLCITPREPKSKQVEANFATMHNHYVTLFTVSFAVYMFSTEAVQGSVHHFLASSSLIAKNNDGQAIFWGLICSVRFLCIIVAGCCQVRPEKILLGCNLTMLLGTVLVCVGTFNKYDFLFGGIVVIAIGIAPVLPTCFLWMANIMRVTHKMCAFMIIISSTGNSLTHTFLTLVLSDSHLYAYIMVTISIASIFFLFLSLYVAARLKSSMDNCFRNCSMTNQFDDEEGLSMLVAEQGDTSREIQHRMAELDQSSQALLID